MKRQKTCIVCIRGCQLTASGKNGKINKEGNICLCEDRCCVF